MMVEPVTRAFAMPVTDMVATLTFWLFQLPPDTESVSIAEPSSHRESAPFITAGWVLTVTIAVDTHVPSEYEIMAVPTDTPVTTPVAETVATVGDALLQVPPDTPSVSAVVAPLQTDNVPAIAPGAVFTVTVTVAEHVLSV